MRILSKYFYRRQPFIIGAMSVYNESDIVEQTILHMRTQDIPLVVIDNGSSDGTSDILERYVGDGIIELSRIKTEFFELGFLLRTLHKMVSKCKPMWMLLLDADEFLESPSPPLNLKQAIELESMNGYNLIQFNNFEFWPTERDKDSRETDVKKRMKYYSWNDNWQFRCFRSYPGTNIDVTGGHLPIFPSHIRVKLSPKKFTMRHYAIRSYGQGIRKIFEERLPRYPEHEKNKWGLNKYTKFKREEQYFIVDSSRLTRYNEDGQWQLERKFDGHRGYGFPQLNSSEEVQEEMEKYRKLLKSMHY